MAEVVANIRCFNRMGGQFINFSSFALCLSLCHLDGAKLRNTKLKVLQSKFCLQNFTQSFAIFQVAKLFEGKKLSFAVCFATDWTEQRVQNTKLASFVFCVLFTDWDGLKI